MGSSFRTRPSPTFPRVGSSSHGGQEGPRRGNFPTVWAGVGSSVRYIAPMATLRLFAGLRDVAGSSRFDIDGATVGEIVDRASEKFGPRFVEILQRSRIWLNGEQAERDDPVGPDDEVALIPPVSGGAGVMVDDDPTVGVESVAGLVAAGALVVANMSSSPAVWTAVVVGVAGFWVSDVSIASARWGRDLPTAPMLLSAPLAVVLTHLFGPIGFGLSIAAAVMLILSWGVASDSARLLPALATGVTLATMTAAATASMTLARSSFDPGRRAVGVFLAVTVLAAMARAVTERFGHLTFSEPFTVTALVAVTAAAGAAAAWDLDVVAFLVLGIVLATAMVAGRGFASMVRSGSVSFAPEFTGALGSLDGAVLAAALYFPLLRVFT